MFHKSIITTLILILGSAFVFAQDSSLIIKDIDQKTLKEASDLINNAQNVRNTNDYQNYQKWATDNNDMLFAKQGQNIPLVDSNISDKDLKKDAVANLLRNYRFRPDDVKKSQLVHFPLMIFVSTSIPEPSLKDLMIQARLSGGVLVFRGLIGGSIKNTANFLQKVSKENVQAIIDPRLFDIFRIDLVPTFVVLKSTSQECLNNGCQITPIHDRIIGNVTLDYALQTIINQQGDSSPVAQQLVNKMKAGGLYEKKI